MPSGSQLVSTTAATGTSHPHGGREERGASIASRSGSIACGPAVIVAPDVSSTDLRQRLQTGTSIGGLVPAEVERYIQRHRLYAAEISTAGHLHEHTA